MNEIRQMQTQPFFTRFAHALRVTVLAPVLALALAPALALLLAPALAIIAALTPLSGTAATPGHGLFAPVARVNDRVVTRYELEQRAKFMTLLRAPGDPMKEALKVLINERLEDDAAKAMGITATPEQIKQGMDEFAKRAKLTGDQFVAELAKGGVDKETFRDFVRAGLLWRDVVRTRFAARVQVSDAEVDRAIAQSANANGLRVLLSEIVLPTPPEQAKPAQDLARQLSQITSFSAFSQAARQYSASRSRDQGGQLPWMPISNLPAPIRSQILSLSPGKVTAPIVLPKAIVLFQMRAIEETSAPAPKSVSVEYARYLIPGGHSETALKEAARIEARADTCDDLYGLNKGRDPALLERVTQTVNQLPKDVALELAHLDAGEFSDRLTTDNGQMLVLLMMCGRVPELPKGQSRADVRQQIANQRIGSYAAGYLAQLRADAAIETYVP